MKKKIKKQDQICPFALHAFFPYWLTYIQDGWFDWVKSGDGVIVQCANPKGIVAKIYKRKIRGKIKVEVEIINNKGDCSWNWKVGDRFFLPDKPNKCSILTTKKS